MIDSFVASADAGLRGTWQLTVADDRLVLTRVDKPETHAFTRVELPGHVQVSGLLGRFRPVLAAYVPKLVSFRLSKAQASQLLAWLGPPTEAQLHFELSKRFRALIPIGIVFLILSLPFGDRGFDLFGILQTSLLLFTGLAAARSPGRYVFLLDASWFLVISLSWLLLVLQGIRSPWLLLWLPFNVHWIASGLRLHSYFAPQRTLQTASLDPGSTTGPA